MSDKLLYINDRIKVNDEWKISDAIVNLFKQEFYNYEYFKQNVLMYVMFMPASFILFNT